MNTKDNSRTKKTQRKLKDILIKKLASKPLKEITVQELCREAKINRTTFYIHYDNLDDLMLHIDMEMQKKIDALFQDPDLGPGKIFTEKRLEKLNEHTYQHADFYRNYLNDFNRLNRLDNELAATWNEEIKPALQKDGLTETELQYRFEYLISGMRGVQRMWLNLNCPETPKEFTKMIKDVMLNW